MYTKLMCVVTGGFLNFLCCHAWSTVTVAMWVSSDCLLPMATTHVSSTGTVESHTNLYRVRLCHSTALIVRAFAVCSVLQGLDIVTSVAVPSLNLGPLPSGGEVAPLSRGVCCFLQGQRG